MKNFLLKAGRIGSGRFDRGDWDDRRRGETQNLRGIII